MKRTRCPHCKGKLEAGQRIHPACIDGYADAQAEKAKRTAEKKAIAEAKVQRVEIKRRKEAIKSRKQWEDECQAIINKIARLRDKDDGCISCDKPSTWGGQWHGSHFRSRGAASAIRFNLWNIHKSCSICNNHLSGNLEGYLPRIIQKIGIEKVEWLQGQNQVVKYDIDYLKRLKEVMGKKLKRMESKQ